MDFTEYDYKMSAGDKLLSLIKKTFKSAEFRHNTLPWLARFSGMIPKPSLQDSPALDYSIHFEDGSIPLVLNSPIILAAGSVKFGEALAHFGKLGFGAVSVGTATRHAREGNPYRPRVGLIEADRMMQNSMGLNNPGIDVLASIVDKELIRSHSNGLSVGLSVSETPGLVSDQERVDDLLATFAQAYSAADYIEVNLSCPNTGHERIDAQWDVLEKMLSGIKATRANTPVRKAVYAKLSPDLSEESLIGILDAISRNGINGVVLFNTFPGAKADLLNAHAGMSTPKSELQPVRGDGDLGGLSGRPLYRNTANAVKWVKERYPHLSILASGGVDHGEKAYDLLQAGADAVQIYSVMGFRWMPALVIQQELQKRLKHERLDGIQELIQQHAHRS